MTTTQTWNRDAIASLIETSYKVLTRGIIAIYRCQTSEEQGTQETRVLNGKGFNSYDARFGSSLAEQLLKGGNLTPGQMQAARRMMRKYAGQLAAIAEAKDAAARREQDDAYESEAAQRAEALQSVTNDEDDDGESAYRSHHAH